MLTVTNVTKQYRKEKACNNISFHVADGETVVLLGPNGAGKSTLIKCITGFLKYQGDIEIHEFNNKTIEAKQYLGYMPEIPSLYPNLTVRDHMEFIARAYRLTEYEQTIEHLLSRFDLLDKQKKFGNELSKGMQQKLSLCCSLLPQPELLIMDEPMIGLDPHAIKEIKTLIMQMKHEGKSLLISTHIIDSIGDLWDKAVILQSGTVRCVITKNDLAKEGMTLEQKFFSVTEGLSLDDMIHETEEN